MVAPVVVAAGAAARAGAVAVGRAAAVAGRAAGSAAKAGARAGAKAASRGTRSAARGAGRSAKGVARSGGKSAAGASRRAGSGAKDLATPTVRGRGSATRNGWNYRNPNQPNRPPTPSGPQGPTGAQVKKFLSNRLTRMLLRRALRRSRKDRKDPRSPLGKARAKARRARRRVRRVVVFAFLLMVVFPLLVAGATGAQMNDAIAAANGDDEQQVPVGGGGDPQGSTEPYRPGNIPAVTQRLLDAAIPEFGRAKGIGCTRNDPGSDHHTGHACDFMVSSGGRRAQGAEERHGAALAAWAVENAEELDIQYVIWQNEIWNVDRAGEGWRPQNKVGSWTYKHYDHVHISLRGAPSYG